MTKNVIKALVVALVAILMIVSLSTYVNAEPIKFGDISEGTVTEGAQDTSGAASSLNRIIGAAITVVQVVGVGVAIIMLIVLAIKYISAGPGDKADIKKHAVVYVVGAVVLFAASGILGIVKNFAQNVTADNA